MVLLTENKSGPLSDVYCIGTPSLLQVSSNKKSGIFPWSECQDGCMECGERTGKAARGGGKKLGKTILRVLRM